MLQFLLVLSQSLERLLLHTAFRLLFFASSILRFPRILVCLFPKKKPSSYWLWSPSVVTSQFLVANHGKSHGGTTGRPAWTPMAKQPGRFSGADWAQRALVQQIRSKGTNNGAQLCSTHSTRPSHSWNCALILYLISWRSFTLVLRPSGILFWLPVLPLDFLRATPSFSKQPLGSSAARTTSSRSSKKDNAWGLLKPFIEPAVGWDTNICVPRHTVHWFVAFLLRRLCGGLPNLLTATSKL